MEEKQEKFNMESHKQRNIRMSVLVISDVFSVLVAISISFMLYFESVYIPYSLYFVITLWVVFSVILCIICFVLKLYHSLWQYSGISEGIRIVAAVVIFSVIFLLGDYILKLQVPVALHVLLGFILAAFLTASRFGYRAARHVLKRNRKGDSIRASLLIVGAGDSASVAIAQMRNSYVSKYRSIIMVDDDPNKQKMRIQGAEVVGFLQDIEKIVEQRSVSDIVIAIPSMERRAFATLLESCRKTGCRVRMLPLTQEVNFDKEKNFPTMREIQISDILFRNEVVLDMQSIGEYLKDRNILVTGGGGSIGSEICRQVSRFDIKSLTIFDIYENTAYELLCELKRKYGETIDVKVKIGSVRDKVRLNEVFEEVKPHIVFHAAAHKHVPLMEDSPFEAIKNNVGGTLNVLEVSKKYKLERFVNLSTDKAVNPTNIMGATKRMTELVIQSFSQQTETKCMSVRFGNVLGSHGSVVPLMERQIKSGGPVTVTHPDIVRYFMTIPEASQLVLQAGALANSGSIYVLDMGEPVRIMELAEKIIRFYGYEPNVDIQIEISGLRPGEKLFEELAMDEEKERVTRTVHKRIFKMSPGEIEFSVLENTIQDMLALAEKGHEGALDILKKEISNYTPWDKDAQTDCE